MTNILVTGATGNVGTEVIRALENLQISKAIYAGHHLVDSAKDKLKEFPNINYRKLDFADPLCFDSALEGIDVIFLLRPPQLADIPKYFDPFIKAVKNSEIKNIVFLSVQGVEDQPKIPHYKMEVLIRESGLNFVFLRPSYFMQNLSSTLLSDIKESAAIFIPAGKLKFTWVDTRDIGKVAAVVLTNFDTYKNSALEITGSEVKGFEEVAEEMSDVLGKEITYSSPNLCYFFLRKKNQGVSNPMIFVMIMLHYLPRFQKQQNKTTQVVKEITGDDPGLLKDFLIREKEVF